MHGSVKLYRYNETVVDVTLKNFKSTILASSPPPNDHRDHQAGPFASCDEAAAAATATDTHTAPSTTAADSRIPLDVQGAGTFGGGGAEGAGVCAGSRSIPRTAAPDELWSLFD
jgi:hypothetical protein